MDDLKEKRLEKSLEALPAMGVKLMSSVNKMIDETPPNEFLSAEFKRLGYERRPIFPIVSGVMISLTGELLRQFDPEVEVQIASQQIKALWIAVGKVPIDAPDDALLNCWEVVKDKVTSDDEEHSNEHRHELAVWMDFTLQSAGSMFESIEAFQSEGGLDLLVAVTFRLFGL